VAVQQLTFLYGENMKEQVKASFSARLTEIGTRKGEATMTPSEMEDRIIRGLGITAEEYEAGKIERRKATKAERIDVLRRLANCSGQIYREAIEADIRAIEEEEE
jgi:hypothetical protein